MTRLPCDLDTSSGTPQRARSGNKGPVACLSAPGSFTGMLHLRCHNYKLLRACTLGQAHLAAPADASGDVLPPCGKVLDDQFPFCALFKLLGSTAPTLRLHLSPGELPRALLECTHLLLLRTSGLRARPDTCTIGQVSPLTTHTILAHGRRLTVGEFPGGTGY